MNGIDIQQVCHYFIGEDAFNWAMSNFAHFVPVTISIFLPLFILSSLYFWKTVSCRNRKCREEILVEVLTKASTLSFVCIAVFWFINAICLFRTCAY